MGRDQKPPDQRRNPNLHVPWTMLPAGDCEIDPPEWPRDVFSRPTQVEKALWGRLWSKPIAWWWHEQEIEPTTVARYVRMFRQAAQRPSLQTAVSSLAKALGLTPEALKSLRLVVAEPEDVGVTSGKPELYRHLKVVSGGDR